MRETDSVEVFYKHCSTEVQELNRQVGKWMDNYSLYYQASLRRHSVSRRRCSDPHVPKLCALPGCRFQQYPKSLYGKSVIFNTTGKLKIIPNRYVVALSFGIRKEKYFEFRTLPHGLLDIVDPLRPPLAPPGLSLSIQWHAPASA